MRPRSAGATAVMVGLILAAAGCGSSVPPLERGLSLYDQGYYEAAVEAFDEAIRQSPRSAAAWANRGVARIRLGDLQGALADFTRALELKPDDPELLFNRGNANAAARNFQAAIGDFTRATEIRPDFARAFLNRGLVRARAGDAEGARADWRRAISLERDPGARAAITRGAGLGSSGAGPPPAAAPATSRAGSSSEHAKARPEDVLAPSEPASAEPGLDARALASRALSRELSGDHAGALADLLQALMAETDPDRRRGIHDLLRLLEAAR